MRFPNKLWCRVIGEVEHNNLVSRELMRQGSKLRKFGAHTLATRGKNFSHKKVVANCKKLEKVFVVVFHLQSELVVIL